MPFVYLILLIIALIKWLLPYIIIGIVSYVVLVLLVHLFKKVKETKKEFGVHKNENEFSKQQIYSTNSFTISQIIAGLLNHAIQQEKAENEKMLSNLQIRAREQARILHNNGQFEEEIEFIKKEMESCDLNGSYYRYWDSLLRTRITENEKQRESCMRSSLIPQMMAGLLSHAIKQEKVENEKNLLNLQIRAREQAHILHNNGQIEEEIEFIKKEMESCDLAGSYYRYWGVMLKTRITENEKQKESCMRSSLISQMMAGLLNHAIQQAKRKEEFYGVSFEHGLLLTDIQEVSDKISTIGNDMSEYPIGNFLSSEIGNDNSIEKVPYWKHTYVYSVDYLQTANQQQKQFYNYFKEEFLNGHYLDIEDNLNYAFILMFDLVEDCKKHKDVDLLKSQLSMLAENYPRTAAYTSKTLLNAIITLNKEKSESALKFYDKSRGQLCRWVAPGEGVEVQGFKLMRGNFYIGECFLLPNNIIEINRDCWSGYKYSYIYGPVLIPNLPIANKEEQNCAFCSYQNMTPSIRYEYLMWLSGKKEPQDVPIEVLLFYLYGCEIRMFVDPETNSTERKIMVDNILQIYKSMVQSQHNFEQFLLDKFGDFIAYSIIKFFRTEIESFNIKSILKRNYTYRDCFISQVIANKETLSPEDVFDISYKVYDIEKYVPSAYLTAAKRLYINKLSKYDNIRIDKSVGYITQSINYNNYNCNFYSEEIELPYTIESIPTGFYNVNSAVYDCYWDIDSTFHLYNREREYSGGKETVMAILLLPQEVELKDISAIQKVIASIKREMRSNQYLIKPIDWILELFEFKRQNAKNIYQSYIDSIISGLKRMGYGIVPNYEIDIKRFNFGDICVIYKNEEMHLIKRTSKYEIIELFIKLASYIVLMDKVLDEDLDFLERQVLFYNDTAVNLRHLVASIRWRFSSKKRPSIDKQIRNAIEALTNEQCTLMGNALIRLACVDGDVHPKRIDGLKKILPLLGIEINNIHSQIHRILTDGEGFATIEKKSGAVEFVIGTEIEKGNNQIDTNIILNSEKLHIFEQQTKNAQELLSEIFVDEDIPTSQNTIDNTATDKWKDVLTLLLSKEKWEREEIENRCQEMGLMLGAVLEQINDFAYDKVDDVVVEDDGEYLYVTLDYKENLI